MKIINWINRIIEYSFYLLFLLVPLVFTNNTSELFEFNKMWVTFSLTIIITGAWISKMIAKRQFSIQRTPLDIPIALFLLSQIISTIFSLDVHTSLWGYYSRFNGGLLSMISYILLYYAFVSNLATTKIVKRLLAVGLISGALVALWGLPSHFGYDPTCFIFRGNFDVSCWTIDFQPKLRIFSTIGQPNWLAAYLNILIPVSLAFTISEFKQKISKKFISLSLLTFIFFLDLLFTKSQSGFLGMIVAIAIFVGVLVYEEIKTKKSDFGVFIEKSHFRLLIISLAVLLLTVFFVGSPFDKLNSFTYQGIVTKLAKKNVVKSPATQSTIPALELNITDSGTIRLIVWKGAIDIWKHYPLFGSGVETFAYSYYQFRPAQHNLTSEWNYLYNKAHNEYLNFLATTGAFGFLTYLSMIFYFLYTSFRNLLKQKNLSDAWKLIVLSLLTGYISILITNFFGFSVVIIDIFFFLIPAFVFILLNLINPKNVFVLGKETNLQNKKIYLQKVAILAVSGVSLYLIFQLFMFWNADKAYFMGSNLDRVSEYQSAYPYLVQSVQERTDEPVFQDELSINNGVLAATLMNQAQSQPASQSAKTAEVTKTLLSNAIQISDNVTSQHSNNVVFWKTRVRLFYTLSQVDEKYLPYALDAVKKAASLAPTDATISYNLGILEGQTGDFNSAIKTLENTIKLRPIYKEAHFGLALFYHQKALDKNGKVVDEALQQKAIDQVKYILEKLDPNDQQAKDALKSWTGQ